MIPHVKQVLSNSKCMHDTGLYFVAHVCSFVINIILSMLLQRETTRIIIINTINNFITFMMGYCVGADPFNSKTENKNEEKPDLQI